jgi:hypothetical protein
VLQSHFIEVLAWLLLFAALLRALCLVTALLQDNRQKIYARVRDHILGIVEITAFLIVLFVVIPFLLSKYVDLTLPTRLFWLETFAGNWSPHDFPDINTASTLSSGRSFWLSISTAITILLNNAIIISIILIAWRVVKNQRRRIVIDLAAALRQRDSMVIATIQAIFREVTTVSPAEKLKLAGAVETAFNKGADDWARAYLPTIANDSEVKEIINTLQPRNG